MKIIIDCENEFIEDVMLLRLSSCIDDLISLSNASKKGCTFQIINIGSVIKGMPEDPEEAYERGRRDGQALRSEAVYASDVIVPDSCFDCGRSSNGTCQVSIKRGSEDCKKLLST